MIIKKLVLHNFGVYASTNNFKFNAEKPVVLIGGMNGRGKTTFLDAVLLALYGSNSFAYTESKYSSYGQYLKSFVNTSDGTLETYVELEFVMESEDTEVYRIRRAWSGEKRRVSEKITVYKDGVYNQFLTDNWSMFIENILPSGLSNFFFFDGEKIAELAVESTSKQMKESIKTLLGISVIDLLKGDLNRIVSRTTKDTKEKTGSKQLELLRDERDAAVKALEDIDLEIKKLEEGKRSLELKLEQKNQDYLLKGGDIVAQRSELFEKRAMLVSRIEAANDQMISDAGSEIPLALVTDLLTKIREKSEAEQDQKLFLAAFKKIQELSKEYRDSTGTDDAAIERFVEFISSKETEKNDEILYALDDSSLFQLQQLLEEKLRQTKISIKGKMDEISKMQAEVNQLDSYLSVDIDEKAISKLYRQIKKIEQEIIQKEVLIENKLEERKTKNGSAITATSAFNRYVEEYLNNAELNDDSDRVMKYSHMAISILDEYAIRLQKQKISVVAETMTSCYKQLANKRNLIDRVEIDPVTLDFNYINTSGEEINKNKLSAGEKQLMVIALLWALAICSKKKLPVIIDTPLSRLDSAHRLSLISTYFPQASEQTIILSTDKEIDRTYYEIMKNNIGDEFTLDYDDDTRATTIRNGYFLEAGQ